MVFNNIPENVFLTKTFSPKGRMIICKNLNWHNWATAQQQPPKVKFISCWNNLKDMRCFPDPYQSKYSPWAIRTVITWDFVKNADSQTYWIRIFKCSSKVHWGFRSTLLEQGEVDKFSSVKGQIGSNLGFAGHMVSVAITQLCHVSSHRPYTRD